MRRDISTADLAHLRKTISRLKRENEIQKVAMDRWCPCPDHRDKTPPKYCPVCENESLFGHLKIAARALDRLHLLLISNRTVVGGQEVHLLPVYSNPEEIVVEALSHKGIFGAVAVEYGEYQFGKSSPGEREGN